MKFKYLILCALIASGCGIKKTATQTHEYEQTLAQSDTVNCREEIAFAQLNNIHIKIDSGSVTIAQLRDTAAGNVIRITGSGVEVEALRKNDLSVEADIAARTLKDERLSGHGAAESRLKSSAPRLLPAFLVIIGALLIAGMLCKRF